ncbi:MAG: Rho termination factor N-terminal domain-containing protein, partial [Actinomycetota bacterium]|nr:Rho termination factor N-terminal domain-containing protein [Actinomycetota bacterium]
MTDTTNLTAGLSDTVNSADAAPAKSSGLAGLKLAQLQALAGQLGITGGSRMRKGDLVSAISDHQRGSSVADRAAKPAVAQTAGAAEREPGKRAGARSSRNGAAQHQQAAPVAETEAATVGEAAPEAQTEAAAERPARGRGRSRRAVS